MMNRTKYVGLLALIVLTVATATVFSTARAQYGHRDATKPATVTVKGEVVDLWCYMEHGARGADHKECGQTCAKAGNPIGLLDAKGHVYLLVGGEKHASNDSLIEKMSDTVTVEGTLVKKGGLEAIFIQTIS